MFSLSFYYFSKCAIVLMLLSAHVEIFSVSCTQDFFSIKNCNKLFAKLNFVGSVMHVKKSRFIIMLSNFMLV